jgi:hypothetical protein
MHLDIHHPLLAMHCTEFTANMPNLHVQVLWSAKRKTQ